MLKSHLLTTLISLSGIGSLLISILGHKGYSRRSRELALAIMVACCLLGCLLYWNFDPAYSGLQLEESYLWIKTWNIRYAVGVDGLSLVFILLTIFTTSLAVLTAWKTQHPYSTHYLSQFFLLQALMISSFAATNAIFFYITWEAILIPILLNIGIWGSKKRAYASIKFFLYTFIGSVGLLITFLYLGHQNPTVDFSIASFYALKLNQIEQTILFLACFIAFTIKIPLWPFHTWLPDAHTEAPTEGSIILAALMLKLGGYGLIRFCLPIMPDASREYATFICILSCIAIIYAGLVALAQIDMKRLVAYASISHMGIVVLGIFISFVQNPASSAPVFSLLALQGAVIQMIAHALGTAGLFLGIGHLYQHFHSRQIADYRGLATVMPKLSSAVFLFLLSTIGLPGTAGFVGEWLVIISAANANFGIACLVATTLILSAAYALWFYGRVFWGRPHHPIAKQRVTMHPLEKMALYLLKVSIVFIGFWPASLVKITETTLQKILVLSLQTKL